MSFKDFTEMPVWKLAFELVVKIYSITNEFPQEEKYGLISDMRRAANSVTNNIAEGFERFERLDKTRFYKFSRGSCYEIINQLLISSELSFASRVNTEEIIKDYRKVITSLDQMIKTIETSRKK